MNGYHADNARRRLSVMEMSEDGRKNSEELNSKISRHIRLYEKAVDDLRSSVLKINDVGETAPQLLHVCYTNAFSPSVPYGGENI